MEHYIQIAFSATVVGCGWLVFRAAEKQKDNREPSKDLPLIQRIDQREENTKRMENLYHASYALIVGGIIGIVVSVFQLV